MVYDQGKKKANPEIRIFAGHCAAADRAATLARLYIGFTNEIQFGALVIGGCFSRGRLGCGLLAQAGERRREDANSQQESKEPNSHSGYP